MPCTPPTLDVDMDNVGDVTGSDLQDESEMSETDNTPVIDKLTPQDLPPPPHLEPAVLSPGYTYFHALPIYNKTAYHKTCCHQYFVLN